MMLVQTRDGAPGRSVPYDRYEGGRRIERILIEYARMMWREGGRQRDRGRWVATGVAVCRPVGKGKREQFAVIIR